MPYQVSVATESTPGRANEDYFVSGPSWAVIMDGATAPSGVESGCIHDVPWLVRHLAGHFVAGLTTEPAAPMDDLLARAIRKTCSDHVDTCDLTNRASPSATVAAIRLNAGKVDYLVLCDSSLVFELDGDVRHIVDDRTAHLADYSVEGVRAVRNTPGTPERPSFWVASTEPDAAYQAVTGELSISLVHRIALLTDGASRWVDRFHLGDWPELLELLAMNGPSEVIRQVRAAEIIETPAERAHHRGKRHDDATAVLLTPSVLLRPGEPAGSLADA